MAHRVYRPDQKPWSKANHAQCLFLKTQAAGARKEMELPERPRFGVHTKMAARNVSVLALYNDQKEILLQHRSKDAPRLPDHWAFFGGGIEGEESPEQALAREIYEELEYRVCCPRLIFIQTYNHKESENKKYVFVEKYNASNALIQHEGQDMRWWKFDDLSTLYRIRLIESPRAWDSARDSKQLYGRVMIRLRGQDHDGDSIAF
ncbi:MAG: NUDIX domain-containing protein, partial [Rhodomicrobium sp.]